MPSVENGITHGSGNITHNTEVFQVAIVGIMSERNDIVAHVVQVPIELSIGRKGASLHYISKDVYSLSDI